MSQQQVKDKFLEEMEKITQLVRASKGLAPEPVDVYSYMMNIKEPLERTGFPTFTILQQAVYLKVGYEIYGEDAKILDTWADTLMKALIAYKRQQRKEAIEMAKRVEEGEKTSFYMGRETQQKEEAKKHFWQRKQKTQTEFKNQ